MLIYRISIKRYDKMTISFASGDSVKEVIFESYSGIHSQDMPIDAEILEVGFNADKKIVLFYVSKYKNAPIQPRSFYVSYSDSPLPRSDFKYYHYVGTIARKGLHVFEVV
jgi:hypothetical protein